MVSATRDIRALLPAKCCMGPRAGFQNFQALFNNINLNCYPARTHVRNNVVVCTLCLKKNKTLHFLIITVNQFSKFFHCHLRKKIL